MVGAFITLQSGLAVYEGDAITLYVSAGTDPNRGLYLLTSSIWDASRLRLSLDRNTPQAM